jgi:GDP-D-mannose 3',5'-epimerase
MVAEIAGFKIIKKHVVGPQGVRGRNSDNTRLREVLGWEPEISLETGLSHTYDWILRQVKNSAAQSISADSSLAAAATVA